MVNKWLQKYLGINHELEEQRYITTQAQLAQLTKGMGDLTEINAKLAEATDKLAQQVKLQSDEIATIKEGFEYQTKEVWLIKKQIDSKAKEPASKPKK